MSEKTLIYLDGGYAKDDDKVYHWRARSNRDIGPLHNPDPKNYYPVPHANVPSFEALGANGYARDKKVAFWHGEIIPDSDVATFEVIGRQFAKDAEHFYFRNQVIPGVDVGSVKLFSPDEVFFKDQYGVYFLTYQDNFSNPRIIPADKDSFVRLAGYYSRDRQNIYYEDQILTGADLGTFEVFPPHDDHFAKDKHHVYKYGVKLAKPDAATFELISQSYSKDKNHVYHNQDFTPGTGVIEGADPGTFVFLEGKYKKVGKQHYDAEDKHHYYLSTATKLIVIKK